MVLSIVSLLYSVWNLIIWFRLNSNQLIFNAIAVSSFDFAFFFYFSFILSFCLFTFLWKFSYACICAVGFRWLCTIYLRVDRWNMYALVVVVVVAAYAHCFAQTDCIEVFSILSKWTHVCDHHIEFHSVWLLKIVEITYCFISVLFFLLDYFLFRIHFDMIQIPFYTNNEIIHSFIWF